jgi:hypothetical protein
MLISGSLYSEFYQFTGGYGMLKWYSSFYKGTNDGLLESHNDKFNVNPRQCSWNWY